MPKNYNLYLKGYVGDWDFSADQVNYVLDKNKDKPVNVLIDSLGGRVDTALSISALFHIHGNVNCHFVGMSASAATIAAMGAKHISIDVNALFLVHKCLSFVLEWGNMNADQLAEHITKLEKMKQDNEAIDSCIAGLYASRCKKTKEELLALMKEGAWLTAEQALEWGFVDEITNAKEDKAPVLTNAVAAAVTRQGMPVPPLAIQDSSFVETLARLITNLFNPTSSKEVKPEKQMKKYEKIGAILESDLELKEDNTLVLSEAAADAVENSINNLNNEVNTLKEDVANRDQTIADLNTHIASLEARIADLEKEPAAASSNIIENGKGELELTAEQVNKIIDGFLGLNK